MGNNDLCFTKWPVLKKNYIYYIYFLQRFEEQSYFVEFCFCFSFLEIYVLQNDNSTC